jgi:hypothetical protein
MSAFEPNDPRDESLWRLLGNARTVEPSPFFTRKVLRAIETGTAERPAFWSLVLRAIAPAAACAALAVLAIAGIESSTSESLAGAEIEFETIQDLDLLASNYESSLWLDPSSPSY